MLTEKQRAANARDREANGRKLRCTKCGAIMRDREPMQEQGDFSHPLNECANRGMSFDWETPRRLENRHAKRLAWKESPLRFSGIERVVSKSYARVRARGAKLASEYRPK